MWIWPLDVTYDYWDEKRGDAICCGQHPAATGRQQAPYLCLRDVFFIGTKRNTFFCETHTPYAFEDFQPDVYGEFRFKKP